MVYSQVLNHLDIAMMPESQGGCQGHQPKRVELMERAPKPSGFMLWQVPCGFSTDRRQPLKVPFLLEGVIL